MVELVGIVGVQYKQNQIIEALLFVVRINERFTFDTGKQLSCGKK